jgi:hypothetical protein
VKKNCQINEKKAYINILLNTIFYYATTYIRSCLVPSIGSMLNNKMLDLVHNVIMYCKNVVVS